MKKHWFYALRLTIFVGALISALPRLCLSAAPTIASISPTSGPSTGGTEVTIYGSNFVADSYVSIDIFSGWTVNDVAEDGTWMKCTTSGHAAGAVDVTVQNPDYQSATLEGGFTYFYASPAPTIASISPTSGPSTGGTEVTIYGSNFVADSYVSIDIFSGWTVNDVAEDGTWMKCTTSGHAAGAVDVTVQNPDYQSATLEGGFTYFYPPAPPTITSVNPTSGPAIGGTEVSVSGSRFMSGGNVIIGGNSVSIITYAEDGSWLLFATPAHAAGVVDVTVRNPDGTEATLVEGYSYVITPPSVSTTSVSSITTNSATSGGNVSSDGGASVLARGVCWRTSPNPTINDYTTLNGQGVGDFTSVMTGLTPGATYYVRAYAINTVGTAYGNEVSFTTSYANTFYVSSDGDCGTKTPCYSRIQDAINNAPTGSVILVKQGTYPESIALGSDKALLVKGGYNAAYDQQEANTTFIQGIGQTTIQAPSGSLKFQMLSIKP